MQHRKCILMCAGEFTPLVPDIDRDAGDIVIAVDGGLSYLSRMGICPDYLLGDFDSLAPEAAEIYREFASSAPDKICKLPVEKDDTDTIAAIRFGLEKGYDTFYLYCAGGGRADHFIANIQTLHFAAEQGAKAYLFLEDSFLFVMSGETRKFRPGTKGQLSVFALSDRCEEVSIRGLKYELTDGVLTNSFPIGISNEFPEEGLTEEASITIGKGTALVVYRYEKESKTVFQ